MTVRIAVSGDVLLLLVVQWLVVLGLLSYVPHNRKPTAAMAWLLLMALVPVLGIALFFAIGNTKLSRRRRERQRAADAAIVELGHHTSSAAAWAEPDGAWCTDRFRALIRQNEALSKLPVTSGNGVTVLTDYDGIIREVVERVDAARRVVLVECYALALDDVTRPLFAACERAVGRGVEVYVLFDTWGSAKYRGYRAMKRELTRIGAHWRRVLPLVVTPREINRPDLRNHRKLIVVDGEWAYIGSQNLIERSYQRRDGIVYDELVARLTGPVVGQCEEVFSADWFSETGRIPGPILDRIRALAGTAAASVERPRTEVSEDVHAQLVPSGSNYDDTNNLKLFVALLYAARRRVVITNPYFIPDESLITAIVSAVKRGVEIVIVNSAAMDQRVVGYAQRSYYEQMITAGVQLYLYDAPTLLHSKHITVDDDIAVVGSSNMDIRSFELNLECVVVAYDAAVVDQLRRQQARDLARSHLVTLDEWRHRSALTRFQEGLARLASALQ